LLGGGSMWRGFFCSVSFLATLAGLAGGGGGAAATGAGLAVARTIGLLLAGTQSPRCASHRQPTIGFPVGGQ